MRQRQVVAEAEPKKIKAAKDKATKNDAAKKLQVVSKRAVAKIKQAKDQFSAVETFLN